MKLHMTIYNYTLDTINMALTNGDIHNMYDIISISHEWLTLIFQILYLSN